MLIDREVWDYIEEGVILVADTEDTNDVLYEACLVTTIKKYTEEEGGFYGQVGDLIKECFGVWTDFIPWVDGGEGHNSIRVLQGLIEKQVVLVYPTNVRKHKREFQDWDEEWVNGKPVRVDRPAYTNDFQHPIFRFVYNGNHEADISNYVL